MSFIDKIKEVATNFLASQNSKYITTEGGLKIQLVDREFNDSARASAGVWAPKSSTDAGTWSDKTKIT